MPLLPHRLEASANQRRLVTADLSTAKSYSTGIGHLVQGSFDEVRFKRSVRDLVARHATLRTTFEVSSGQVYAIVSDNPDCGIHILRTVDPSFSTFRKWALPLIRDNVDIASMGSLACFLVADYGSSWRCYLGSHPVIADGVSFDTLLTELLRSYAGVEAKEALEFFDFDQRVVATSQETALIDTIVKDLPDPVGFLNDAVNTDRTDYPEQFVSATFPDIYHQLGGVAANIETTSFGILLAVFALGLRGFSGETAISTYFQSAGRRTLGIPSSVAGSFSNSLPLDVSIDIDQPFETEAKRLRKQLGNIVALENTALTDEVVAAQKQPRFAINLSPVNYPMKAGELAVGPQEYLDRFTEFDLNLVWLGASNDLIAHLFFNVERVSPQRAKLFLDFQDRLIRAILATPKTSCRELLRTARKGHEAAAPALLQKPAPTGRIHEDFFAWAERTPSAKAIITSERSVTYAELAAQAHDIARALGQAGVGPKDSVAIVAQRNTATVAAMLGTSAFGSPFVLVDASYPSGRIDSMLAALNTIFVLEAGDILSAQVTWPVHRISPQVGIEFPLRISSGAPREKAYYLFTSGTSGRPKPFSHPDTTLLRFIHWQAKTINLGDNTATIMMSGLAHDPTLRDVFLPFSVGGHIVIPSPTEMNDPAALRDLISVNGCNLLRLSASLSRLVTAGAKPGLKLDAIEGIFWGGERVSSEISNRWTKIAPNARQFNVFGSTETPQAFALHEILASSQSAPSVPIGRPLDWTGIRIVDEAREVVSVGEIGEIVAELADPVFGANSGDEPNLPKAYRTHFTGDRGYQMHDGTFCFSGRKDRQVKLNGFRVELEEIEAIAEKVDNVIRARAVSKDGVIVLLIECGSRDLSANDVKLALYRHLPNYMMPSQILPMAQFPLTANGKIDDAALFQQAKSHFSTDAADEEEEIETPAEELIATIIENNSAFGRPSRKQSLLDIGADSLASIEIGLLLQAKGFALPSGWTTMPISSVAKTGSASFDISLKSVSTKPKRRPKRFIGESRIRPVRQAVGRIIRSVPGGSALLRLKPRHSLARQMSDMMAATQDDNLARRNLRKSLECVEPYRLEAIFGELGDLSDAQQLSRLEKLVPFWHIVKTEQLPHFERKQLSTHCEVFLSDRKTNAALICFPGNGRNMFILFTQMMMMLGKSEVPPVHLVILRSEHPGSYGSGVPGLGDSLGESLHELQFALTQYGVKNRAYLGASIGGFFALRAGLLDTDTAAVSLGGRFTHLRSAARLKHNKSAYDPLLCSLVPGHASLHCVYGAEMTVDRDSAERLKNVRREVHLHPVSGVAGHNPLEKRMSPDDLARTLRCFAELAENPKMPFEFL